MNQKLINTLMFTAGAAIGSLVTWRVLKSYYERYVQEEIDKFVEDWSQRDCDDQDDEDEDDLDDLDEIEDEDDEEECGFDEAEIHDYHLLAKKYGREGDGDDEVQYINGPYVISPDEFGDGNFKHALKCLTYYADGVLSNDWYETFDVEETIGEEALKHFGDYQTDVVHVRNEREEADYEVVRDPRTFADVTADDPLMAAYAT